MPAADFSDDFRSDEDEFEDHGFTTGDVEDIDLPLDDEDDEDMFAESADPDLDAVLDAEFDNEDIF